jgi:hypothetical protein
MTTSEAYNYTIEFLCENLNVSKSGFYQWKKNRGRRREQEQREYELVRKIEAIHIGSKKNYGSPRIHGVLKGLEPDVSLSKVERLMKKNGIRARTKKKFKVTTDSKHNLKVVPNHLMQDFTAQRPDQVWVSDITYVPTKQGFLYLCTVLDVFSRKVVGWTLENNMRADMVKEVINFTRAKDAKSIVIYSYFFHCHRFTSDCYYRLVYSFNELPNFLLCIITMNTRSVQKIKQLFSLASIRAVFDLLPDLFPLLSPRERPTAACAGFRRQVFFFDSLRHQYHHFSNAVFCASFQNGKNRFKSLDFVMVTKVSSGIISTLATDLRLPTIEIR